MTGGKQSGEGFRGEEKSEVGDEQVEQGQGKPAHLEMMMVMVAAAVVVVVMKRRSVRSGVHS